jgi:4-amino-4-deoxy-L-arabinose transferase-like glycosyltransferase
LKIRWIRIALILFIFSIALLIRIQYINKTIIPKPIVADAQQYVIYGYNLITHGIYSKQYTDNPAPDSFRSPGYPMFIALAFFWGGDQGYYPIIIITQVILSSLLVLLTYYIGSLFLRIYYAVFAAILVSFSPHLISISSYVLTETFFCFFLLSSTICFIIALQKQRPFLFFSAALLFGYTYLVNETALFIPFIFVFIFFLSSKFNFKKFKENKSSHKIILFLLIFALFPAAWTLRNNISLSPGAPTGASRAISTLSHGAYPGFIYKDPEYKYFPYQEDPMQPEFGSSLKSFIKILWERFKEDPLRYLKWYLLEKPYYLWSWNILQGQGDVYIYPVITSLYMSSYIANLSREIMKYLHPVCLILALTGVILMFIVHRRDKNRNNLINVFVFPFSICICFTLIYTIFVPWPRYSVPLRPELYLCAIWCVEILIEKIMRAGSPLITL